MKIFYVHHALREKSNIPNQKDDIVKTYEKDAKLVSKLFLLATKNGFNIKAVYTSPYLRCKKTAELVNQYIKVPVIEDERLNEFASERQAKKYGLPLSETESWTNCQARIMSCLKDIVEKYDDSDAVICVTSGVNIAAFINLSYQIKPSEQVPFLLVPSCSPIGFEIKKESFNYLNPTNKSKKNTKLLKTSKNELISTPQKLLDFMSNNFEFGYISNGKVIDNDKFDTMEKYYNLSSPEMVKANKRGVCWDFVEFERDYFESKGYALSTYAIVGDDGPLHTFLIYKKSNNYYYFEFAWNYFKGIHKYNSLDTALNEIYEKMKEFKKNKNQSFKNPRVYEYTKPEYGINFTKYKNHLLSSKCIKHFY